jgi:hypothetical protein
VSGERGDFIWFVGGLDSICLLLIPVADQQLVTLAETIFVFRCTDTTFSLQPNSKDNEVAVRHNAETVAMLRIATRFRLTAPIFGSKLRRRAEAGGALNVHYSIV